MKKIIVALSIIAVISSFKALQKAHLAKVAMRGHFEIYSDCMPVDGYDVIGFVVDKHTVLNKSYDMVVTELVTQAQKQYPTGEGMIVHPNEHKAEIIKFR